MIGEEEYFITNLINKGHSKSLLWKRSGEIFYRAVLLVTQTTAACDKPIRNTVTKQCEKPIRNMVTEAAVFKAVKDWPNMELLFYTQKRLDIIIQISYNYKIPPWFWHTCIKLVQIFILFWINITWLSILTHSTII